MSTYLDAITRRRSQYALGRNVSQTPAELTALIQEAIRQAPSSFNSQSSRAVILHGEQSVAFWEIVKDELRKIVPAEAFATTEGKINSFAAGTGTVLAGLLLQLALRVERAGRALEGQVGAFTARELTGRTDITSHFLSLL